MQYIMLGDPNVAKTVCILSIHLNKESIQKTYLQPYGLDEDAFMAMSLYQDPLVKKTPKATLTEYAKTELIPTLQEQGIKYLLCTDPEYFKVLSGEQKVEGNMGYILPCVLDNNMLVAFAPSYKSVFYDPDKIKPKIERALHALAKHWEGDYVEPGSSIVKFEQYPNTVEDITNWLDKLIEMDCPLTCDIEAFSLKHHTAGIGSITFCWNQHEGIAFLVDYVPIEGAVTAPYGNQGYNAEIRALLVNFFRRMQHKVIYHNVAYDAYVLIYQLFMSSVIDTAGLLEGIKVMLRDWDCTKLIAYLATNSCAGNDLKLKTLAQSFAGDWAQEDIKDIRNIPSTELLRYNLIDGLSTWFVHTQYYVPMVMDLQSDIYENLFQPTTVDLIQMQLTGMPLNMKRVVEVKNILQQDFDSAVQRISGCVLVQEYEYDRKVAWVEQRNLKLKKKRVTLADADVEILKAKNDISWNPNSYPQMQELLYSRIGLPVIELTDSKQPAVDGDTVKNLKNHTTDPQVLALLDAFIDYTAVNKILTSFIPAMENAALGPDGWHYLFGSFNLGGTVSGRLSASNPNLQQLPANGMYAKLIKSCFQAPPGWLFCGLDFASLEDRISALTTKDPNKMAVYLEGFDGHSLRAQAYFKGDVPDIERAPEGAKCYRAMLGTKEIYFHEHESIVYMGKQVTGAELFQLLSI
jgi:DNA polymerase-1